MSFSIISQSIQFFVIKCKECFISDKNGSPVPLNVSLDSAQRRRKHIMPKEHTSDQMCNGVPLSESPRM